MQDPALHRPLERLQEVVKSIHSKWWSTEALQEVSIFNSNVQKHGANNLNLFVVLTTCFLNLGGSLASDDLYLLDLRNGDAAAQWMIVPVVGRTPSRRYGHTIVFSKPYLLVFGGNTGTEPVNDVWCLNVDKAPFTWENLRVTSADKPAVRAYHASALCTTGSASGMMVTFGGRTADQSALKDTWGLRRHRDGRWDWVQAPYKNG